MSRWHAPLKKAKARSCAKHYLLRLARIGAHEQHAAVAEPDMSHLHKVVTPLNTTISWLQSNWKASPGAKASGT